MRDRKRMDLQSLMDSQITKSKEQNETGRFSSAYNVTIKNRTA